MTDTERRIIHLLRMNPEQAEPFQRLLTGQEPPSFERMEEKILAADGNVQDFIQFLEDNNAIDAIINSREGFTV